MAGDKRVQFIRERTRSVDGNLEKLERHRVYACTISQMYRAQGGIPRCTPPPVFRDVILTAIRSRSGRFAHTLRHLRSRAPPICSLRAYACRLRYFFLSGLDSPGTPTKLRASRKPRLPQRIVGTYLKRNADRQNAAPLRQLPPRITRFEPFVGPIGSVAPSRG